uniref:Non-haem dioxygenase N-terminal domain-containing protein n=1 Tax=Clastoptera arizonana TaxID=38151 RepID=A0A1B6DZU2_9HEMI
MTKPTLVESNEIFIIDYNKLVNIKHEIEPNNEVKKIAKDLREAFQYKKAVFLVNHTISKEDENKVYSLIRKFSALPNPIKEKYKSIINTGYHGYTSQQSERINKDGLIEFKESYNIIGYNRYLPDEEISEFSKTINTITEKLLNISNILLQLFAISLDSCK